MSRKQEAIAIFYNGGYRIFEFEGHNEFLKLQKKYGPGKVIDDQTVQQFIVYEEREQKEYPRYGRNQKQLRIGVRVLVNFYFDYYRGDGSSAYGIYKGYDKRTGKYMVAMEDKVSIPHHKVKRDKISGNKYLSETHRTNENAVAYVNRDQIIIVGKNK